MDGVIKFMANVDPMQFERLIEILTEIAKSLEKIANNTRIK